MLLNYSKSELPPSWAVIFPMHAVLFVLGKSMVTEPEMQVGMRNLMPLQQPEAKSRLVRRDTQRNQTWPRIWFFPADMIIHAQLRCTSQPTFWPNLYKLSCQIDSKHAEEQFWHLWFSSSNGGQKKPWKASQRARVFFIHESPSPLKIVLGTCKTKKIEAFAAGHLLTSPSFPHLLPNWPLTPPQQKTGCMLPPSDALTRLTALASFCSVFCTCNWVTQSRARHLCQEDAQLYKKFYLTKVSI